LFFDVARIIDHHKPSVVFLENVKRFKTHDKGNTFNVVKATLEDMGYEVHAKILNARDFGVPQNRERIYIVAFLGETNFEFPEPTGQKTRLGDILEKKVDDKYTLSDKLWAGHQSRKRSIWLMDMDSDTVCLMRILYIQAQCQHATIKMVLKF